MSDIDRAAAKIHLQGAEERQWKVEVKVRVLAQEVKRLAQKCNEENRNVVLLEDTLKRYGEETG